MTALVDREHVLLVFVDGLPFQDGLDILPEGWAGVRQVPTLGYSVNIKAELFAGKTPEDLGWFCEWNPGSPRPRWQRATAQVASLTRGNEYLDYAAHRVLERLFRERLFNVPLECLGHLHRQGRVPYDPGFALPNVFDEFGLHKMSYFGHEDRADDHVYAMAQTALQRGSPKMFVPLVSLDGITHADGLAGSARLAHLDLLRQRLDALWSEFRSRHPDALGVLVSDHGLADVSQSVALDVRALLKSAGAARSSLYTIEATILRVWCDRPSVVQRITRELDALGHGRVLGAEERSRFSLGSRRFGELIFVLDEGKTFVPCTMTKRTVSAAMHGYLPHVPSQHGIVAASEPSTLNGQFELTPLDFHRWLTAPTTSSIG